MPLKDWYKTATEEERDAHRKKSKTGSDRGDRREREVKRLLIGAGFAVVKAGGSLGVADLVCWKKGQRCMDVFLVSIKSSAWPSGKECTALLEARNRGTTPVIIRWLVNESPESRLYKQGVWVKGDWLGTMLMESGIVPRWRREPKQGRKRSTTSGLALERLKGLNDGVRNPIPLAEEPEEESE